MDMNIAKLLDKLEYRVVVFVTNNGCVVSFPDRKQTPTLPFILMSMQYTEDGVHIQHTGSDGVELHSTIYECPPYAQRLLGQYYIMMTCIVIRYSLYYIKFMIDLDKEVSESEFFHAVRSPYMSEEMEEKEAILGQILMPCMAHGFDEQYEQLAREHDVLDGFLAVKQALALGSDVDE